MKTMLLVLMFSFSWNAYAQLRIYPFSVCSKPDKLFFVVKNTGKTETFILENELPWKYSSNMISYKAFSRAGSEFKILDRGSMIFDSAYRPSKIKILPGSYIYGDIYLYRIIDDFSNAAKKSEIFLFYKMSSSDSSSDGMIFIPRRKFLSSQCPALLRLTSP